MNTNSYEAVQQAHAIDMKHTEQRNDARGHIWWATTAAVFFFGIGLLISTTSWEPVLTVISPKVFSVVLLGISAGNAGFAAMYFMWMKDYQLTVQKGILGELQKLNETKE